ncbi:MAG: hypothetical protein FWD47_14070 [Treponema sp.]|nr:hypothetical protein [Treponema sp.]
MTITQTIDIPADRRITLEVPRETPMGKASVEYKIIPFVNKSTKPKMTAEEEKKWINDNIEWLTNESNEDLAIQNKYLEEMNK